METKTLSVSQAVAVYAGAFSTFETAALLEAMPDLLGRDVSRQAIMNGLKELVERGAVVRISHGRYARPEPLKGDERRNKVFDVVCTSLIWEKRVYWAGKTTWMPPFRGANAILSIYVTTHECAVEQSEVQEVLDFLVSRSLVRVDTTVALPCHDDEGEAEEPIDKVLYQITSTGDKVARQWLRQRGLGAPEGVWYDFSEQYPLAA